MSKVNKAICKKDGLETWTVITDCLSRDGETPFLL
jgi:hypothetical protein